MKYVPVISILLVPLLTSNLGAIPRNTNVTKHGSEHASALKNVKSYQIIEGTAEEKSKENAPRPVLRILEPPVADDVPRSNPEFLPRGDLPVEKEKSLVETFALQEGFRTEWVRVESYDSLIPSLVQGKGDLIIGSHAASIALSPLTKKGHDLRKKGVRRTIPVAYARGQIVGRDNGTALPKNQTELAGRRVAVRKSSPYWEMLAALRRSNPKIEVEEVPETMDTEEVLYGVATGKFDLAAAESTLVRAVRSYRNELSVAFDLTGEEAVSWAVAPGRTQLLEKFNRFLSEQLLAYEQPQIYLEDWPKMRQRKTLRILTVNSPTSYFLVRGKIMGFEYDLAHEFAERNGLRVEVVVPPNPGDLFTWLQEGKGDVVAAFLPQGSADTAFPAGISATAPHSFIDDVFVTRTSDNALKTMADLSGRTVIVKRTSPFWDALEELRSTAGFKLVEAPAGMDTLDLLERVTAGEFDVTVAESTALAPELGWRDDLRIAFPLRERVPYVWAVRSTNPKLRRHLDDFLRTTYRSTFYNMTYRKYFRSELAKGERREKGHKAVELISPYDSTVRKYAEKFGFDWRLIVAQMYQESKFDPKAVSPDGAIGLLQVLPSTARALGFPDARKPETSIHAGMKYLAWLRDQFESDLEAQERMWFAIASYNSGYGHIFDARRLAAENGLDPNVWFGNVERALLLLSKPYYASRARYGYARARETVDYVRRVRTHYYAYIAHHLKAAPTQRVTLN